MTNHVVLVWDSVSCVNRIKIPEKHLYIVFPESNHMNFRIRLTKVPHKGPDRIPRVSDKTRRLSPTLRSEVLITVVCPGCFAINYALNCERSLEHSKPITGQRKQSIFFQPIGSKPMSVFPRFMLALGASGAISPRLTPIAWFSW